jgi:hypothetical protein
MKGYDTAGGSIGPGLCLLRLVSVRFGTVRSWTVRTGASLNDADPVRILVLERKQRLLGSDYAVRVIFSVVAEQAHGDPVRHGANRRVVAGEIVGVANFAARACTAHQLLDLAALASVEGRLAGVEVRIERHDPLSSQETLRHNGRPCAPV